MQSCYNLILLTKTYLAVLVRLDWVHDSLSCPRKLSGSLLMMHDCKGGVGTSGLVVWCLLPTNVASID